ncbi:hypothetical protein, partial [Vibrio parahaemolyticus]|uniref:hypothetical protein n=1 Tax=Vibrio parahaemolyticus TaxID=670 RepID=UPI00053A76C9
PLNAALGKYLHPTEAKCTKEVVCVALFSSSYMVELQILFIVIAHYVEKQVAVLLQRMDM